MLLAHCILFAPRFTFGYFYIGDKQDFLISKVQSPNNYDTCKQFCVIVIQGTFFQFLGLCYVGLIIEFFFFLFQLKLELKMAIIKFLCLDDLGFIETFDCLN